MTSPVALGDRGTWAACSGNQEGRAVELEMEEAEAEARGCPRPPRPWLCNMNEAVYIQVGQFQSVNHDMVSILPLISILKVLGPSQGRYSGVWWASRTWLAEAQQEQILHGTAPCREVGTGASVCTWSRKC